MAGLVSSENVFACGNNNSQPTTNNYCRTTKNDHHDGYGHGHEHDHDHARGDVRDNDHDNTNQQKQQPQQRKQPETSRDYQPSPKFSSATPP